MKLKIIAALIILFTLASCSHWTETVKVDGKYTIDIPSYLKKTDSLNTAASLQYQNPMREFYVLVFDEPIKDFNKAIAEGGLDYKPNLDGYSEILANDIAKSTGLAATPKMQNKTINNLKARTLQFTGKVNNLDIFWKIAYVEGKNNYYQILTWTLSSKQEDHKVAMDAIINSFKETDKSKTH